MMERIVGIVGFTLFLASHFAGSSSITLNDKQVTVCEFKEPFELIFAIDGSGGVSDQEFLQQIHFVYDAFAQLDISAQNVWVGLIQWSSWSRTHLALGPRSRRVAQDQICQDRLCTSCYLCQFPTDQETNFGSGSALDADACQGLQSGDYPIMQRLSDGDCDSSPFSTNSIVCGWDGTDCCNSTCSGNCSRAFACLDPDAADFTGHLAMWEVQRGSMTKDSCAASGVTCDLLPQSTFGFSYQGCPNNTADCCFEYQGADPTCQIPQMTLDTHPHTAFDEALKQFEQGRDNVPKLLIVVTDGKFNSGFDDLAFNRSAILREQNITIIGLGVSSSGEVNLTNIERVVSSNRTFLASDFSALAMLLGDVLQGACEVVREFYPIPSPPKEDSDNMLLIILVIVCGVLVCCLAGFIVFSCRRKSEKRATIGAGETVESRKESSKGMEMVVNPLFLKDHHNLQNRLAETESKLSTVVRSTGSSQDPLPSYLR